MRLAVVAISFTLGLGYVTRYSGLDAVFGLAFTRTGWLYAFFGTFLGWLGVALTGSDTSSNALFGSLQRITSQQFGIDPVLMCAANSAGGVMGKMVDAQSITIATATAQVCNEGIIFRFVVWHSITLGAIAVASMARGRPCWMSSVIVLQEQPILNLLQFHRRGAFVVVVPRAIDPRADGIAPHQPGIVGLQHFGRRSRILHTRIEPEVVGVWIKDDWHTVMDG